MEQAKLDKILNEHKEWLRTKGEKGSKADLFGADLHGANLDYSAFPLCCGGLNVHIDDRQAIQLLYHLIRNVQFSKNVSAELKDLLSNENLIATANKFHRVKECGKIEMKCEDEEEK